MTAIDEARMLLRDRDEDNSVSCRDVLDALENLLTEHEEMLAKYDALRTARPFTAGRPVFELPIKDAVLKQ